MSINHEYPSLQTLPVEILHRIYDCLDIQTILFSVRSTCRRLKAVVNSYDRCILDVKQLSQFDLQRVSRLPDLRNIISLTLSGNDERFNQVDLFISLFGVKQFTRLQILTLSAIKESQLRNILKRINIHSITSFSLSIKKNDNRREGMIVTTTTETLLSSILTRSNLQNLELNIHSGRIEKIIWRNEYTIEYLSIGTLIDFGEICTIVNCLPRLRTLVLKSFSAKYVDKDFLVNPRPMPFRQLVSLTVENLNTNINDVEQLLSLTPSLVYLKLIGTGNFLDGNRWEHFIRNNLTLLNKFDFLFHELLNGDEDIPNIESIIIPFQTTFWLENKKWFIICEYNIDSPEEVRLYSIPICLSSMNYEFVSEKISLSTFPGKLDNNVAITDNIKTIIINFEKFVPTNHVQKKDTAGHLFFHKVEKLELTFNFERPSNWVAFIPTIIEPTTIKQIKITGQVIYEANSDMVVDITNLLGITCNVSFLDICANFSTRKSSLTAMDICAMTPAHVRYLAVSIKNTVEVTTVLHQLQHLSSANFFYDSFPSWNLFVAWLKEHKKGSTYYKSGFSVFVWLEQINLHYKPSKASNKRIKLTDDHYNV